MNSKLYPEFPQAGDILTFSGVPKMYYPMFTNMRTYANERLVVEEQYKVSKSEVYSSWVAIWLEGHGENFLNYSFFEKKKLATEQKIMEDGA
jgi:hypothetical protein